MSAVPSRLSIRSLWPSCLVLALACSLLLALTGAAPRAHAAEGIELYTPYTELSAPPGESISYSIEVINDSSATQQVAVGLTTEAADWQYELTAGGRAIRTLAVKSGESQTLTLQLEVPLQVEKGAYTFRVTGGAAALPLTVNVSEAGTFSSELTSDQANLEGYADTTFSFTASLRNRTGEAQTYALSADSPAGWDVRFKSGSDTITSIAVEPNASQTITVEAVPPQSVAAGTYPIPIRAANNATSAETSLEAVVTGNYGLALSTSNDLLSTDVTAGGERRLDVVVTNTGTAELQDVSLTSQAPVGWEVTFEPATITSVAPGETANAQVRIKSSGEALAGDYAVSLAASSAQKADDLTLRVAVKASVLWGWIGVLIVVAVAAGIYYLFRKYGRR
ncbi:hypothetical protein IDH44_19130 [Paenibacillus sp. IB182496]|uniref:Alpha-galactosidase NEW3 domain-containing protein n=1 Tax=Paenibacillus sabuli TaxID=2772509 RepID=A0A927GT06_9BACL|nr:NEW3 domain-containing protein [Paenibacillus sabuli]MBD2847319.1 hypothetical protein [Paenibacillus sabuli]